MLSKLAHKSGYEHSTKEAQMTAIRGALRTIGLASLTILFAGNSLITQKTFAVATMQENDKSAAKGSSTQAAATIIRTIVYRQISNFQSGSSPSIGRMKMSADGSKIVFATDGVKKVFTINTDGTNFMEVFDYATFRDGCPCGVPWIDISADGSKIIWTDSVGEIFIANSDGSSRQRIATEFPKTGGGTVGGAFFNTGPRITADGSRVYFYLYGGDPDTEGAYVIGANGANLQKLFSYRQISALFGQDGSEYNGCGANRFTGQLDISDDGSRLIFGTACFIAEGAAIVFDGAALRILTTSTGRVASTNGSDFIISGDGNKIIIHRVVFGETYKLFSMNFGGGSQVELLSGTGSSLRFGRATTNGAAALTSANNYPMSLVNTDGSGRVDLVVLGSECDVNPLTRAGIGSTVSLSANGGRFAFTTEVPGEAEQIWIADINPISAGDASAISEVTFTPPYVVANRSTSSTFTARISGGQGGVRQLACSASLKNGAYGFSYIGGGIPFGIGLFDDGKNGDATANDGIFTQTDVRNNVAPPDAVNPLQIRVHAIANSLRHITAVDATPFFVLAQAPAGSAPVITTMTPASGYSGVEVTISGTGFDPFPANNVVLFGNRQAFVKTASADRTTLTVIVPSDLPRGTVAVTVTVAAQTSNVVNFNFITSVQSRESSPTQFDLSQNYPNPFNPETKIQFELPAAAQVRIEIYNIHGQKIRTLIDGSKMAGFHTVLWDGRMDNRDTAASGVYIYRLQTGEFAKSKRLLLLR
jgi:hypothetical protein